MNRSPLASNEQFQFVSDPVVRERLLRDIAEIHGCMQAHLWKASIILIGSLIESVLYYHMENTRSIRDSIPKFEQRDIHLNDLLQWARKFEIIDDHLLKIAEPIRDYRNSIHPRVQSRLKVTANENLVQIGYSVLLEIIRRINLNQESLKNQDAVATVTAIVNKTCGRNPTKSDFWIYLNVLQKYGKYIGPKIIERSLRNGLQN